jgi:hypothetical protein
MLVLQGLYVFIASITFENITYENRIGRVSFYHSLEMKNPVSEAMPTATVRFVQSK